MISLLIRILLYAVALRHRMKSLKMDRPHTRRQLKHRSVTDYLLACGKEKGNKLR
jgi:hypothetical protein